MSQNPEKSTQSQTQAKEVVVVRQFALPVPESRSLHSAVASNVSEVAKVAASGGVQGIRWVSPQTKPGR